MSSAWALGQYMVLGLGGEGQPPANLTRTGECVLNFPAAEQWAAVEQLRAAHGQIPRSAQQSATIPFSCRQIWGCRSHADTIPTGCSAARTGMPATVRSPRSGELSLRRRRYPGGDCRSSARACPSTLVIDDNNIAPQRWRPLIYNFRHYFGLGQELGKTFTRRDLALAISGL